MNLFPWFSRRILSVALSSLALAALFGCFGAGTDSGEKLPKTCQEISDSVFAGTGSEPMYKVLSPNGGEVFHIGDTLKVILSAKGDSETVAYLSMHIGSSFRKLPFPNLPSRSLNTMATCDISFVIPDSIPNGLGKKISMVSDSVKVQMAKYNAETILFDYSDGFFRIDPAIGGL